MLLLIWSSAILKVIVNTVSNKYSCYDDKLIAWLCPGGSYLTQRVHRHVPKETVLPSLL